MADLTTLGSHACFGGTVSLHEHHSESCDTPMRFAAYKPPQAADGPVPALYYLAGLTSTEETFVTKGGAQRYAAERGLMLVAPDTSPRNLGLPGEDDAYDFGSGAGFYIDATVEPWSRHYRMYSYVTRELPALVEEHFPARPGVRGIFGHSMGGHGALTIALKNPDLYQSVSAFAPIVAPARVPWGEKAFSGIPSHPAGSGSGFGNSSIRSRSPGGASGSDGSSTSEAKRTARQAARGRRAHHR